MYGSKDDAKLEETQYINDLIHITLDIYDCKNVTALNDVRIAEQILVKAARVANMTIVDKSFHKFGEGPQGGLTGVVLLAKSHISIHTYPLHNFVAADIFTCDSEHIMLACDVFKKLFRPANIEIETKERAKKFHIPRKYESVGK